MDSAKPTVRTIVAGHHHQAAWERPGAATLALERLLAEVAAMGAYRPLTWWGVSEHLDELTPQEREQLDVALLGVADRLEARRDRCGHRNHGEHGTHRGRTSRRLL